MGEKNKIHIALPVDIINTIKVMHVLQSKFSKINHYGGGGGGGPGGGALVFFKGGLKNIKKEKKRK